jgi:hypothetical protein
VEEYVMRGANGVRVLEGILIVFLASAPVPLGAQEAAPKEPAKPPEEKPLPVLSKKLWRVVSETHLIVTGTLRAPVEVIRQAQEKKRHDYATLTIEPATYLKGDTGEPVFRCHYYTEPASYLPSPGTVMDLDGKAVVLFAVFVSDAGNKWYVQHSPLAVQALTPETEKELRAEVENQRAVIEKADELLPVEKDETYEKTKALIEEALDAEKALRSYEALIALGQKAVPAMIALMDDRRDLAVKQISLKNPPGHWEAMRHYGPKKVVDLLDAILNDLVGFGGSITNGGSESERKQAVDGWRIYLYFQRQLAREKK